MTYTKKDLMPKRYPENKPSEKGLYWVFCNGYWGWWRWNPTADPRAMFQWDGRVDWFIDIPGAPDEVKPVKWIRGETKVNVGWYLCHRIKRDVWEGLGYYKFADAWIKKSGELVGDIDYFINIPLESEEKVSDVIWDSDLKCVIAFDNTVEVESVEFGDNISFSHGEFTDVCKHWLSIQKPEKPLSIKKPAIWQDGHVEICPLDGFHDVYLISSITNPERYVFVTDEQLGACEKAVRERVIAPCPNPECKQAVKHDSMYVHSDGDSFWIECCDCLYRSPRGKTASEAIRLHNKSAGRMK